jgi:hypothetical protein
MAARDLACRTTTGFFTLAALMDVEHKIIFEELAMIRASVLQNTKMLQKLLIVQDPNTSWDELTQLLEADQNTFLESIRDRLKKGALPSQGVQL